MVSFAELSCYYAVCVEHVDGCVRREYGMGKCGQRGDGTLRLSRRVHRLGCRRSTKAGWPMGSWAASGREWECWGFVIR